MQEGPAVHITALLSAVAEGNVRAREQLWAAVYAELRRMAERQLAGDALRRDHQPTTLVHEAYIRLVAPTGGPAWANRRHFFAAAARAMRHIRVDGARKKGRIKRGGDANGRRADRAGDGQPADVAAASGPDTIDLLALDDALTKLEALDSRKAEIVMCRYFAGLTIPETAEALELSPRTIDAEWRLARAWLFRELAGDDSAAKG